MTEQRWQKPTLSREGSVRVSRSIERALIATLTIAVAGLLWLEDLNSNPWSLYSLLALGFGSLLVLAWIYHLAEGQTGQRWVRGLGTGLFLGVSLGLRLLVIPLEPSLSNDVQRYLWDGHVVVSGENPYALAPSDPRLERLREDDSPHRPSSDSGSAGPSSKAHWQQVWLAMSHRSVETVYPPVAMGIFSIAALGSDLSGVPALWLYKGVLVSLDLLGCWALLLVARRFGVPAWRSILYAWNPLVLVEVAGMGHIDGAGLLPVALTLLFLESAGRSVRQSRVMRKQAAAAVAAVAAVAVKLVPLMVLPLWLAFDRRRTGGWLFALAAAAVMIITFTPVVTSVGGVPPGLVTYGVSWEFNGPLYEPLYRFLQIGASESSDSWSVAIVKQVLDVISGMVGDEKIGPLYGLAYPQFLAKGVLAGTLLLWLAWFLRGPRELVESTRAVFAATLLCIATVYPWYLLWVLPWAALSLSVPWLIASASLMLAYLPRITGIDYFPLVYLLVWLPPGLSLFGTWLWHMALAQRHLTRRVH